MLSARDPAAEQDSTKELTEVQAWYPASVVAAALTALFAARALRWPWNWKPAVAVALAARRRDERYLGAIVQDRFFRLEVGSVTAGSRFWDITTGTAKTQRRRKTTGPWR